MDNTFLNPYNFIELPKQKAKAYQDEDRHTGVIEYTITTRSPLFIPNTSSDKAFQSSVEGHSTFDFYSYNELDESKNYKDIYFEPVIPGSELRGMIRGIYETLTDSCMGVFDEKMRPIMRIGQSYRAGLIQRKGSGKFLLVSAEDCAYLNGMKKHSGAMKLTEGCKVYFLKEVTEKKRRITTEIQAKRDSSHPDCGYLIKGMPDGGLNKKCNFHIFIPKMKVLRVLSNDDINGLKSVIEAYQKEPGANEPYKGYKAKLEEFLDGKGEEFFPVYYSTLSAPEDENGYYYLAPACLTKELSEKSLGDLAGTLVPCKKYEEKCPACDLFGMTGSDNTEAGVSKVRVTDAYAEWQEDVSEYYDDIVTLEALGKPRIVNVEFYLKRPAGAAFWNYDYFVKNQMVEKYDAVLRGRKYYWHQRNKKLRKDIEATKLNKSVRPVKSGVVFSGKLFFDGISEKQLSQMIWILNGGNEEEKPITGPIAYKLGMGKPLGLGSVELKVTKVQERVVGIEEGKIVYSVSDELPEAPMYSEVAFCERVKSDFFTISSLDAAKGKLVTYPITSEQKDKPMTEGYKWFVKNHGMSMVTNRSKMKRKHELPAIGNVETLPMDIAQEFQQRKGGGYKPYNGGYKKPYNNGKNRYDGANGRKGK